MLALNGADQLNGPPQWGSLLFCLVIVLSLQRAEGSTEETGSSYTKFRTLPASTDRRSLDRANLYVNDQRWGRIFVRICPYLPFSARVCLNQHHWLANRMREESVDFQQCSNAFLRCGRPERLQELADALTAEDLSTCGQKWLARFTPSFTARERKQAGCQHRLFFSQIEFCDNLITCRRAALDKLGERLLDANRTIGSRTRSPSSSAAKSPNSTAAGCRPRSKT
jgi:hypothetical protein